LNEEEQLRLHVSIMHLQCELGTKLQAAHGANDVPFIFADLVHWKTPIAEVALTGVFSVAKELVFAPRVQVQGNLEC
jgi:hypothetical protein